MFTLPDQAGDIVPWKTWGISPHGKYYRSLPWSPWADNTTNKHFYLMCVSCPPVPIKKYKSSEGLLHFTMTLWVRQRLPDGGEATSAQITLLITLGLCWVLFLLPKKSTGILRPGLISIQTSSRSQSPSLVLIKLVLQSRV